MELLQPVMLWGALAIAIPVLIHFWHQKKGKVIAWAATQWLHEKNQQQHRGIRLDNLLLLLLRCMVLLVLALLLSHPVLDQWKTTSTSQKVHLIQPDSYLTNNYRFELEEAARKGEPIYWVGTPLVKSENLIQPPAESTPGPFQIQSSINQLRQNGLLLENQELHLYLLNPQQLSDLPFIQVPSSFQLHAVADTLRHVANPYLELANGHKLYVNVMNSLTTAENLPAAQQFQSSPAHRGRLAVLLDYEDQAQQLTVRAALKALIDVYGIPFEVDVEPVSGKKYDWVFTDQVPANPSIDVVYVVPNGGKQPDSENNALYTPSNVYYTRDELSPNTSEMVANGQLPEWLGELLVKQYGLNQEVQPLSRQELNALFVEADLTASSSGSSTDQLQKGLLVLLILLIGTERGLALTRQA